MEIERQLTLEDVSDEYAAFVAKFKPKKTTDDCYTPDNIYEVVKRWACREYDIDPANIVRPFWPGGDYVRFEYTDDSVVVDNPPFSIVSDIARFYNRHGIPFFMFAPYLTNLGIGRGDANIQHVIVGTSITYENGAQVGTSFITNMDSYFLRSAPDLAKELKRTDAENLKKAHKQVPKYSYPPEVVLSSSLGYLAVHGVELKIGHNDTAFIRTLDSQRAAGKSLFGAGFLLSERAAAERAAAERAAAERAAAERWSLSEAELLTIEKLGHGGPVPTWSEIEED